MIFPCAHKHTFSLLVEQVCKRLLYLDMVLAWCHLLATSRTFVKSHSVWKLLSGSLSTWSDSWSNGSREDQPDRKGCRGHEQRSFRHSPSILPFPRQSCRALLPLSLYWVWSWTCVTIQVLQGYSCHGCPLHWATNLVWWLWGTQELGASSSADPRRTRAFGEITGTLLGELAGNWFQWLTYLTDRSKKNRGSTTERRWTIWQGERVNMTWFSTSIFTSWNWSTVPSTKRWSAQCITDLLDCDLVRLEGSTSIVTTLESHQVWATMLDSCKKQWKGPLKVWVGVIGACFHWQHQQSSP